ncbi:hypothetical protein GCM10022251_34120 [Phytohabitans flavus]|uniref:Uncharacterized protein n=1 Tax=Phytohabitans flavus TaxID=1076124 RepID=A0A6F8XNA4_9ACTN|nr:hypothetical protein [Phytohabitans flavus]BCB75231.1 hypothetical protein Pflav_016410 [Phytohabitans flavus]
MWEVVGALGSAGSALLAATAGFVAYRLYRIESERDRRTEMQLARQQAASVGVWIRNDVEPLFRDEDEPEPAPEPELTFVAANMSTLPVYRLSVHFDLGQDKALRVVTQRDVLLPGERFETQVPTEVDGERRRPVLTFRDNAGAEWRRDSTGYLGLVSDGRVNGYGLEDESVADG